MSYWRTLSGREKALIIIAAILALCVGGQLLILRPLLIDREAISAKLGQQNAILETLAIVPRAPLSATNDTATSENSLDNMRRSLLASASNSGLSVNRIQANDNSLTLYFDRTIPELFFVWLRTVEAEQNLEPEKFSIRRIGTEEIRANVEFVGR